MILFIFWFYIMFIELRPNNSDCPSAATDSSLFLEVSPLNDSPQESKSRPYLRTMSPDNYAGQASNFYGSSTNTAQPSAFRNTGRALNIFPSKWLIMKWILISYNFLDRRDLNRASTLKQLKWKLIFFSFSTCIDF